MEEFVLSKSQKRYKLVLITSRKSFIAIYITKILRKMGTQIAD